ncbi:hypothetical protein [Teichococcus rhizosphaerae]|nr:hypothetical protein [Pseudoroseomonas rhizosphaerae]
MNTHTIEPRMQTVTEALKAPLAVRNGSSSGLSQAEIRRLVMETIG